MKGTSLFAAIVAILVAFTAYDYWSSQKKDEAKAAVEKIVRVDKATLKFIEVAGSKNRFRLEKTDGHWNLTEPFQESADQQVVMTFIEQLFSEKSQADVAGTGDLKKYGLDAPVFTLHVASAAQDEVVKLGSVRAFDNSLYALIDGDPQVKLVTSAWDVMLSKPVSEFRDTKVYRGAMGVDFEKIQVTGPSNFEITREKDKYVLKNASEAVNQDAIKAWLEQIKALRGAAYVENPKPGFKPQTTITLELPGQKPFFLQIAPDRDHPQQFEVTSSDLPGQTKSRVLVSPRALDPILVKPDAFYDRKSPFAFDPKRVASVRFNDQGQTRETKVDPANPDELITQLSQLEALRFLGPPKSEKKFPSKLTLLKSDGSVEFEMSWGEPVIEKSDAGVEAQVVPVKTNLSKQIIGVPEKQIAAIAKKPVPEESGADSGEKPNDEKGR